MLRLSLPADLYILIVACHCMCDERFECVRQSVIDMQGCVMYAIPIVWVGRVGLLDLGDFPKV